MCNIGQFIRLQALPRARGIDNYGRNRQIVNVLRLNCPMSSIRIKRRLGQYVEKGSSSSWSVESGSLRFDSLTDRGFRHMNIARLLVCCKSCFGTLLIIIKRFIS